ncbi:MAG: PAS domain-containing protein [Tatlockia sp.]|nr:PAS domain-containing protein [Tatlockia sp.]
MELHKLLMRQLEKMNISFDELPDELENWQGLITRINKTYLDTDQERYLLERSIDISSREMLEINTQLEYAQELVGLCYWHYNPTNLSVTWSKGIYSLLQINPLNTTLSYLNFLKHVHSDDRVHIKEGIEKSLKEKIDFDFETRIHNKDNDYRWFRLILKNDYSGNQLSGVIIDINNRKESEVKIRQLNSALLTTARLAGMSEVATAILHNVGNILNSINVSVATIKHNIIQPHYRKLASVVDMIKNNIHQLNHFLLNDHKGRLVLPYLGKLAEILENGYQINIEEFFLIDRKLNHIKEIVDMQQSISGVAGVSEKIFISELLNDSIEMSSVRHPEILLTKKETRRVKTIISDKPKIVQILTNLLRNAKEAVLENGTSKPKKISILVNRVDENNIKICIKDNGMGIPIENLNKIFSFGFTTKTKGHGFGLHSSALSAKELGGSLNVESLGINKGSEFILMIPVANPRKNL